MAASLDGTNGLTFNDGTLMGSANSLGMRNRIINGDMRIDQRNAGAAVTVGLNPYLTDRFFSSNETGIGTITAQQLTLGNSRSLRLTATAAITDLTNQFKGIVQAIESQNCFDLNNKTVTVSFIVETNWTGNLAVAFRNSAATRAYVVNAAVVSGINNVSVTLPFEAATVATNNNLRGLEFFIGANSTNIDRRTATTGAWVAGVFICSTASTNWTTTAGNFINVTNVQLEEGSVATPFERRPIGLELALSQRYCQVYTGIVNQRVGLSGNGGNTSYPTLILKTIMRSTPTLTVSSASHFNIEGLNGGKTATSSLSADVLSPDSVTFEAVTTGITGSGTNLLINSTSGKLTLDSEL